MARHKSNSYKHPIRIEQRTDEQDDYEDTPAVWATVVDASANIRTLTSREQVVAQQNGLYTTHEISMRFYPGIDSQMRIRMMNDDATTNRIFHIDSVHDVDEEHFELAIQATEKR